MKKRYCVYVEEKVVDETVKNIAPVGGKLSPLVESKLKEFNTEWKKK